MSIFKIGVAGVCFGFLGSALAQQASPDTGALIQLLPKPEALVPQPSNAASESAPVPVQAVTPKKSDQRQFMVKTFRLTGNTLLSSEALQASLSSYVNRSLTVAQMKEAAQAVARRYRQDGWVVSAYLPAQDITAGVVMIEVKEAKTGQLHVTKPDGLRGPAERAQAYFDAAIQPGQPLNADAIDRAQMLGNELLGLEVGSSLKASQQVGTTDVWVQLRDQSPWQTQVTMDNHGARSTGEWRLIGQAQWRNPLSAGDQWSLSAMHSDGSDYARVGLGLPVGAQGWRVGASASDYRYRLISPEFAALRVKGEVQSLGLDAMYPLVRQRDRSLSLLLNADDKTTDNRANGAPSSHSNTSIVSVGLQGYRRDGLGRGGVTSAQLGLVSGNLDLTGSPTQSADAQGAKTAGDYTKLNAQIKRTQILNPAWSLSLSHAQQWASKNLDSSEKFYIGGPDSVRAFPGSEAGGAEGSLTSVELSWRVSPALTVSGFYDYGQVRVNVNNQYVGAPALNTYSLQGGGLSLLWRSTQGWTIKSTLARRAKSNPKPTDTGTDQDGSLVKNRLWVSAAYTF